MTRRSAAWLAAVLVLACLTAAIAAVALSDDEPLSAPQAVVASVMTACKSGAGFDIGIDTDGDPRLLTHDERSYGPTLSPDGRLIAFVKFDEESNSPQGWSREQLWVMQSDGQEARPLTDILDSSEIYSYGWSPDSRSVMYLTGPTLNSSDVASGSTDVVLEGIDGERWWGGYWQGASDPRFAVSPDGAFIVTGGELSIIDLSDGVQQPVASGEFRSGLAGPAAVTWSPDGEWLVMKARSRVTRDPEGGVWAFRVRDGDTWHLDDGESWRISENTNVEYQWVGPNQLLNVRSGEGGERTAYVSDLRQRRSTAVEAPQAIPTFPDEIAGCAR